MVTTQRGYTASLALPATFALRELNMEMTTCVRWVTIAQLSHQHRAHVQLVGMASTHMLRKTQTVCSALSKHFPIRKDSRPACHVEALPHPHWEQRLAYVRASSGPTRPQMEHADHCLNTASIMFLTSW